MDKIEKDNLTLSEIGNLLCGQKPNADPTHEYEECLEDLLEIVNNNWINTHFKGKKKMSTKTYAIHFYEKYQANELTLSSESLFNIFGRLENIVNNAIGEDKDNFTNFDPRGKIKTRYDKNPFWGDHESKYNKLEDTKFSPSPPISNEKNKNEVPKLYHKKGTQFFYSKTFRYIKLNEEEFRLSINQSRVIEILFRAREAGRPFLEHAELLESVYEGKSTTMRIKDIFRSETSKEIMKKLGEKGKKAKKIVEAGHWWQHFKVSPVGKTFEFVSPYWSQIAGTQGGYFSGYGPTLPQINYETFGTGFSQLPAELGGQRAGAKGSRLGGTPLE